ncbi:MAG: hypothetical protein IK130_11290 [Oscillospiraceae bacterium]|nr:hypothetical protein [Oscillospiraceae bacterium]
MSETINKYRDEAQKIGVFLPLSFSLEPLSAAASLHGFSLSNRNVLMMQPGNDAAENGAPSEDTLDRYTKAVQERAYSIVWIEPAALTADSRYFENGLVLSPETEESFRALVSAIVSVSEAAHGIKPLVIALLDHAGHHALKPVAFAHSESLPTDAPLLTDEEITDLIITCANSAKTAEKAGFSGVALNAADRSLFGESLAAFHREGKFGGDFDDRTRFVRDCYTAIRMMTNDLFFAIRLTISDGIPQPDGWGMAFEDESAPDIYEPALLIKILRALYGLELIACSIGIPDVNWMFAAEPEAEILRVSRLCTCIAMMDSDMQENVQLILPQALHQEIPFESLAAGMIGGEFASFAGFQG